MTPDMPFSVEDLTSDYIFYVQDSKRKAQTKQDVFSFYISDGNSQTEAFNVEIDIQVTFWRGCRILQTHGFTCKYRNYLDVTWYHCQGTYVVRLFLFFPQKPEQTQHLYHMATIICWNK